MCSTVDGIARVAIKRLKTKIWSITACDATWHHLTTRWSDSNGPYTYGPRKIKRKTKAPRDLRENGAHRAERNLKVALASRAWLAVSAQRTEASHCDHGEGCAKDEDPYRGIMVCSRASYTGSHGRVEQYDRMNEASWNGWAKPHRKGTVCDLRSERSRPRRQVMVDEAGEKQQIARNYSQRCAIALCLVEGRLR